MRVPLCAALGCVFLAGAARADEAQKACKADYECPGRELCLEGFCQVPVSKSALTGSRVGVWVGVFGEYYPFSSEPVSGSSTSMAVLAGLRVGVGWLKPKLIRAPRERWSASAPRSTWNTSTR